MVKAQPHPQGWWHPLGLGLAGVLGSFQFLSEHQHVADPLPPACCQPAQRGPGHRLGPLQAPGPSPEATAPLVRSQGAGGARQGCPPLEAPHGSSDLPDSTV